MAADHNWSFDKIFGDDDFIAAGQLIIPPRGRKPSKAAKDNTYVRFSTSPMFLLTHTLIRSSMSLKAP